MDVKFENIDTEIYSIKTEDDFKTKLCQQIEPMIRSKVTLSCLEKIKDICFNLKLSYLDNNPYKQSLFPQISIYQSQFDSCLLNIETPRFFTNEELDPRLFLFLGNFDVCDLYYDNAYNHTLLKYGESFNQSQKYDDRYYHEIAYKIYNGLRVSL